MSRTSYILVNQVASRAICIGQWSRQNGLQAYVGRNRDIISTWKHGACSIDGTATRLFSSRGLLRCSYKCLGKLWAVITRKFMRWIALLSSKFAVNNNIEVIQCLGGSDLMWRGKWKEILTWKICVTLCYETLFVTLEKLARSLNVRVQIMSRA